MGRPHDGLRRICRTSLPVASPCGDMTPRAIVAGGGNLRRCDVQSGAAGDSCRWEWPFRAGVAQSVGAPEQTLLDGAEIGEALACLEVPRRPRDKGLLILRRCRLGARIGPSALAVPAVRGRQDHQRRGGIGTSRWWLLTALPSPTCD